MAIKPTIEPITVLANFFDVIDPKFLGGDACLFVGWSAYPVRGVFYVWFAK